jgi:hypothetical protein
MNSESERQEKRNRIAVDRIIILCIQYLPVFDMGFKLKISFITSFWLIVNLWSKKKVSRNLPVHNAAFYHY